MGWVVQAVLALAATPRGFTASELAEHVRQLSRQNEIEYGARRAAYGLKKLRGKQIKQIVQRIAKPRVTSLFLRGFRAIAALVILREKAIKPLLATVQPHRPSRRPQNPTALDAHYATLRTAKQDVFQELGVAA